MQSLRKTRSFVMVSVIYLLYLLLAPIAYGNVLNASVPIPVEIDSDYDLPSSLYLNYSFIEYMQPLTKFAGAPGTREAVILQIWTSLRSGDVQKAASLSRASEEACFGGYKKVLEPVEEEQQMVLQQAFLGDERSFWFARIRIDRNIMDARPFYLSADDDRGWLWNPSSSYHGVDVLLRRSATKRWEEPSKYQPASGREFTYEIVVAGQGTEYPVTLQFNGTRYNIDLLGEDIDPSDEVAAFYQKTWREFYENGAYAHSQFYTPISRQKYVNWLDEEMNEEQIAAYMAHTIGVGRTLLFIMDADPVYIVFYRRGGDKYVSHDYVIRDPNDGALRLANFFFFNLFTNHFVNNDNLFRAPVLQKLIGDNEQTMSKENTQ